MSPDWSLAGTRLSCGDQNWLLDHRPFHWADGVWETEVTAHARHPADNSVRHVIVRVTSRTLRDWKELAIDPIVEACAQLRDHLRGAPSDRVSLLTLL